MNGSGIKNAICLLRTGLTARYPRRAVCFSRFVGRFEVFFHMTLRMRAEGSRCCSSALCCVCQLPFFQGPFQNPTGTGGFLIFTGAIEPEETTDGDEKLQCTAFVCLRVQ